MFVCRAYIPDALQPKDYRAWPFTVPCVAELAARGLEFTRPVTFLGGDNGSGKSTLVEVIAEGFNLDSHGGRAAAKTPRPAAPTRRRPRSVQCCDWRPPPGARGCCPDLG